MTPKMFNQAGSSGDQTPEGAESHPDPSSSEASPEAQLHKELDRSRKERDEWHDRYLRKAAEFDNYRKRSEKEKLEFVLRGKSAVLTEVLPVLDACERARESFSEAPSEGSLEQYREGVELLFKQLRDTLERLGVSAMQVVGEPFDPHQHEAVSRETTTEFPENTVIHELRKGYLYKDRLMRPAQVVVATPPETGREEDPAEAEGSVSSPETTSLE